MAANRTPSSTQGILREPLPGDLLEQLQEVADRKARLLDQQRELIAQLRQSLREVWT